MQQSEESYYFNLWGITGDDPGGEIPKKKRATPVTMRWCWEWLTFG
ncbi:hypothetical protein [Pontibacter ruber]|uniref:Uncharacterized protein n=1 Tax=Pontibacter ruber TaxID=1343895 RepID=A0ABW5CUF0_9BACT|nr:hypothetical protein [Pontibacter ruber]